MGHSILKQGYPYGDTYKSIMLGIIHHRLTHQADFDPTCVLFCPGLPGYGTSIMDYSASNNHGTIHGTTWVRNSQGLWVNQYDGTDDYIDFGTITITTAITVMFWVTVTTQVDFTDMVSNEAGGGFTIRSGLAYTRKIQWYGEGSWGDLQSVSALTDGVTYFIACTAEANSQIIYINGVANNSGTNATTLTQGGNLYTSKNPTYADRDLTGQLALLRIFNQALSAGEILGCFNQERHLFGL